MTKKPKRKPSRPTTKQKLKQKRPLHKKVFLHPITVLMLLCAGVFIVGWTYRVIADSQNITVKAVVAAPPLLQGAAITSQLDGLTVFTEQITISGSCPANSYVKLYDNNLFAGVAICSATNTFQFQTQLFSGKNVLIAQDFNVTDNPGPGTSPVTVNYLPVIKSPAPTPLILTSDFRYQTFTVGHAFSWPLGVDGGVEPYVIKINWGDGQSSRLIYKVAKTFNISHVYTAQGYYTIQVTATDAANDTHMLQLAALIKLPGAAGIVSGQSGSTPAAISSLSRFGNFFSSTKTWLWVAWPSFAVVLLMTMSFWLGERQEYRIIMAKQRRVRRNA